MKLLRLVLLLAITGILTVGLVIFFVSLSNPAPKNVQRLPYLFMVSDTPGVDTGRDVLRLGAVMPGTGGSWRMVTVQDTLSSSAGKRSVKRVRFQAIGDGSQWLRLDPVESDLPAALNVSLRVPDGMKLGTYRGEILITPLYALENAS